MGFKRICSVYAQAGYSFIPRSVRDSASSSIVVVLLFSATAQPAMAWSPPSHLLRAWRAYEQLTDLDAMPVKITLVGTVAFAPTPFVPQVNPVIPPVHVGSSVMTGQGGNAGSSNGTGVSQAAEVPVAPAAAAPQPIFHGGTTYIVQQVEPELIPAQQITYAPVSNTIIRAIQNITNYNIISILQACGSLCFQYADINALAISAPTQSIIGLSSNNGSITQTGTFSGSGSTGAGAGAQNVNSNVSAGTDVTSLMNTVGGNTVGLTQISGSGAVQAASLSAGSYVFPTSVIQAGSSNNTTIYQGQ